jgi:hypothetical protein
VLPSCATGLSSVVTGLAQSSNGTVYAVTDHGCIFTIAPGGQPTLLLQVLDGSAGAYLQGLAIDASGTLYSPTIVDVWTCSAACDQQGSWRALNVAGAGEGIASVCQSSQGVWAFGGTSSFNDGAAWHLHPTSFDPAMSLSVQYVTGCWTSGADLYAAARDAVVHLGFGFTVETATATSAQLSWRGGGTVNGVEFLAGTSSKSSGGVLASRSGTSWSVTYDAMNFGNLSQVVGVSSTEGWAFGSPSGSSGGQVAWQWNGASWAPLTPDVSGLRHVASSLLSSDGIVWVGGDDSSGAPALVRGAR